MGSFVFKSKALYCHEGELKFHTAAGAQMGTVKKWAGAGRAGWCELDKGKLAYIVTEKGPVYTEKLRRRIRDMVGILEQLRSKKKRHRGAAHIMKEKGR